MNPNLSASSPVPRPCVKREAGGALPRPGETRSRREPRAPHQRQPLARYTDPEGRSREVIVRAGSAGTVLVVDRDAATREDRRLLAHLDADEPIENAALVCRDYLHGARADRRRCRRLTDEDAWMLPRADDTAAGLDPQWSPAPSTPSDPLGGFYTLELLHSRMSIPELRWCRSFAQQPTSRREPVSLREAIARLESYEPVITLTNRALLRHRDDSEVSSTVLRAELARVQESPIVLNRRLREVVLAIVEKQELSMSEIAIRCGRVKRDRRGNESGETSWLARRLGLLPEGGKGAPTPWIHSDVLGLIARRGLGVSPREVEA
jgi:hypothetical protein